MSRRRVVVTGLGAVSPLGLNVKQTWDGIVAAKSGIAPIEKFDNGVDVANFTTRFAGQVKNFNPLDHISVKEVKKMDLCIQYGLVAALEAWQDSNLELGDKDPYRYGVAVGSGIGGLSSIETNAKIMFDKGPQKVSPFFIPASIINMISGHVAMRLGLKGPNIAVVSACTTGTHNIGYGMRTIAYGDADVMVVGGSEKSSCATGIAGFGAVRALSKRNEDPEAASRPWDKDRDGFVMGDGAAVMVLEEYEHAKARGAKIYAELVGFGMSADAYHITMPDGEGGYRAMLHAVQDADISAGKLDYVNAHATSTPAGDVMESQSIERLLGSDAARVSVSSTKSMIGHLLGAAGAIEGLLCVKAIESQIAPPTINLDNPDEGCTLDYVPHEAKSRTIDYALSNSFGFGGTNGSVLFKRI